MKRNFRFIIYGTVLATALGTASCQKGFLDVVPDNVATLDDAFSNKTEAEKYLRTCYSFLPSVDPVSNILYIGADDMWTYRYGQYSYQSPWKIALGEQTAGNPWVNFWDGENHAEPLWKAIRECNIFLENMYENGSTRRIPYLSPEDQKRWIGEVTFLKAYYHYCLFKNYGPIPIVDVNIPVSATPEEVKVFRQPVDEVAQYLVNTLDKAIPMLPTEVTNRVNELGRITRPAAMMLKARVLTAWASPLFNGNTDFSSLKDKKGTQLFNPTYDANRWALAAKAAEEAVAECAAASIHLYEFNSPFVTITDATRYQLSAAGALNARENQEAIWALTGRAGQTSVLQTHNAPKYLMSSRDNYIGGYMSPTLKMAENFYTKNGVPISEDKTWNYQGRFDLRVAKHEERFHVQEGYTTASLHFDREERFYANLGFDGGRYFLEGNKTDEKSSNIQAKYGQPQGKASEEFYSVTGYFVKKFINYKFNQTDQAVTTETWAWPEMRLADLFLLYAEALNESGQSARAIEYVDKVRERAGLKGVEESWSNFSNRPTKFTTKEGLRDIIRQERLIEMAFEGHRLWDLRRWKLAVEYMNQPVEGWDILQKNAADYYRKKQVFNQRFVAPRDYLWPIKQHNLIINTNLLQNPGW
ncbi:RagB/SusD family nutrient uptake outer membrane protein [Chitinophaga caseinilytica]|uniref:RagB/SusD family nutrient uptake outer membrane protein n=1 Tax=Chitinophaga caseinilytica TaxID=2267521 RepID=A0ABZ2Z5V5_9BACT